MCPDCRKPTKREGVRGDVCEPCWQWRLDKIAAAKRGECSIQDVQRELEHRRVDAIFG